MKGVKSEKNAGWDREDFAGAALRAVSILAKTSGPRGAVTKARFIDGKTLEASGAAGGVSKQMAAVWEKSDAWNVAAAVGRSAFAAAAVRDLGAAVFPEDLPAFGFGDPRTARAAAAALSASASVAEARKWGRFVAAGRCAGRAADHLSECLREFKSGAAYVPYPPAPARVAKGALVRIRSAACAANARIPGRFGAFGRGRPDARWAIAEAAAGRRKPFDMAWILAETARRWPAFPYRSLYGALVKHPEAFAKSGWGLWRLLLK